MPNTLEHYSSRQLLPFGRCQSKLPIEHQKNCTSTDEKITQIESSLNDLDMHVKTTMDAIKKIQELTSTPLALQHKIIN